MKMYSIVVDGEMEFPIRDGKLACLPASYLPKHTSIVLLQLFPIELLSFPHEMQWEIYQNQSR